MSIPKERGVFSVFLQAFFRDGLHLAKGPLHVTNGNSREIFFAASLFFHISLLYRLPQR
jgi:hypothetical protein